MEFEKLSSSEQAILKLNRLFSVKESQPVSVDKPKRPIRLQTTINRVSELNMAIEDLLSDFDKTLSVGELSKESISNLRSKLVVILNSSLGILEKLK